MKFRQVFCLAEVLHRIALILKDEAVDLSLKRMPCTTVIMGRAARDVTIGLQSLFRLYFREQIFYGLPCPPLAPLSLSQKDRHRGVGKGWEGRGCHSGCCRNAKGALGGVKKTGEESERTPLMKLSHFIVSRRQNRQHERPMSVDRSRRRRA